MNIKIIISLILFVTTHHNFCMITCPSNEKRFGDLKARKMDNDFPYLAQFFINSFTERSLKDNYAIITNSKTKYAIKPKIELLNNNPHDLTFLNMMELPKELHIKTLCNFFEDNKNITNKAMNLFYTMQLKQAVEKYNNNESSWLKKNNKLSNGLLFLSTDYEKTIVTRIYQKKKISENDFSYLIWNLNIHILEKLCKEQVSVKISTNVNQFKTLILTPYQMIRNIPDNRLPNLPIKIISLMFIREGFNALSGAKKLLKKYNLAPHIIFYMSLIEEYEYLTWLMFIPDMFTHFHNETIKTVTLG